MIRLAGSAALVLLLAACVPPPAAVAPAPVPSPTPTPRPVAPPPVVLVIPPPQAQPDWTSAPLAVGDWTWRMVGANSVAEFHTQGNEIRAAIACLADQRQVMIGTAGGDAGIMTVRTESLIRSAQSTISGPFNRILVAVDDPLLDAIAFSRGRFAVEVDGGGYYLPPYPEITRVIEDCR